MTRAEFDSLTDGDLVSLDDTAAPAGADVRRKLLRVIGPVPGGILAVEAVILTDPAKVNSYAKQGEWYLQIRSTPSGHGK